MNDEMEKTGQWPIIKCINLPMISQRVNYQSGDSCFSLIVLIAVLLSSRLPAQILLTKVDTYSLYHDVSN